MEAGETPFTSDDAVAVVVIVVPPVVDALMGAVSLLAEGEHVLEREDDAVEGPSEAAARPGHPRV